MNNTDSKANNATIKRRVFTKTQLSASKVKNRSHQLSNNFFSRQNTYGTIDSQDRSSQGSLYKYEKVRSYSNKNLFHKARFSDNSSNLYNQNKKKIDNFVIPKKAEGQQPFDSEGKKKKVISSLIDQMTKNKRPELKIHKNNELPNLSKNIINNSLLNASINENKSIASKRKIQQILNLKFESRKENLQKSQRVMTQLIEYATQTQEDVRIQNIYSQTNEHTIDQHKHKKSYQNEKISIKKQIGQTKKIQKVQEKKVETKKQKVFEKTVEEVKKQEITLKKQEIKKQSKPQSKQKKPEIKKQNEKKEQGSKVEQKKNNYFNDVEEYAEDIQSINLDSVNMKSNKKTKSEQNEKGKTNYGEPQQLSFINKKEGSEKNKRKQSSQSDDLNNFSLSPQSKVTSFQSRKTEKQKIKQQFQKTDQMLALITPLGQVAPQCAKDLKKVKLNWHLPSVLLYKQCYTIFKRQQSIYKRTLDHELISKSEYDKFIQENEMITVNLQKLVSNCKKKGKIRDQYESLLDSSSLADLQKYIHQEVLNFSYEVLEGAEKDNIQALRSCLRMINGVLILAKLRGKEVKQVDVQNEGDKQRMRRMIEQKISLLKGRSLL